MARVRLRGPLRRMAGDLAEHVVEADSVIELLKALERAHGALDGWILDERGRLRPHLNVFVNGELAQPEDALGADDRVDVIPAISGG